MSLVQVLECTQCGFSESIPYDSMNLKMPWEVWNKGCPKCGNTKVDITVIHDKLGRFRDAKIIKPWCFGSPNQECDCEHYKDCVEHTQTLSREIRELFRKKGEK